MKKKASHLSQNRPLQGYTRFITMTIYYSSHIYQQQQQQHIMKYTFIVWPKKKKKSEIY